MKKLYVNIGLNQLYCHQKPDSWIEGEPYMWNVFFKIDGHSVRMNERFRLEGQPTYHTSEGSHGNLSADGMEAGTRIGIPKEVGEWKTALAPIEVPFFESHISGVIGVVCVLMEQNYVSGKGAEAGRAALGEYIRSAIDASIVGFDPRRVDLRDIDGSIKAYFDAQVRDFTARIGDLVGDAVSSAQSLAQNILSLVKKDVLIGFRVFDFSNAGIEAAGGQLEFGHRWAAKRVGEWEVRGRISAKHDEEKRNAIRKDK
ncbi:MAG: hypothetical protein AAF998_18675 [Bacteroidota bacterium]